MAENERRRALRLVAAESRRAEPADALAALADAAARGERAAVRAFLVSIGPQLLRVVRRVLGVNHPAVDDVLQESAFAVVDALPRRRRESTVLHFACRIAVLTALNVRRREAARKRHAVRAGELEVDELATEAPAPDVALAEQSSVALVLGLMDSLPIGQAEVLALHCVLGYTLQEVAETADLPLKTVRSRVRVARQALRELLGAPPDPRALEESS